MRLRLGRAESSHVLILPGLTSLMLLYFSFLLLLQGDVLGGVALLWLAWTCRGHESPSEE